MFFGSVLIILVTVLTAVLGGMVTQKGLPWYRHIKKPQWTPSGSVIGSVWTVLYTLIAIAAIVAYNTVAGDILAWTLFLFAANAVLNAGWSALFFGFRLIGAAIIDALLMEITILVLVWLLWTAAPIASFLLIPYALWVGFATYLTYKVWYMNR